MPSSDSFFRYCGIIAHKLRRPALRPYLNLMFIVALLTLGTYHAKAIQWRAHHFNRSAFVELKQRPRAWRAPRSRLLYLISFDDERKHRGASQCRQRKKITRAGNHPSREYQLAQAFYIFHHIQRKYFRHENSRLIKSWRLLIMYRRKYFHYSMKPDISDIASWRRIAEITHSIYTRYFCGQ